MKYNIEGGGEGDEDACCTVICVFWFGESAFHFNASEEKNNNNNKKTGVGGVRFGNSEKEIRAYIIYLNNHLIQFL